MRLELVRGMVSELSEPGLRAGCPGVEGIAWPGAAATPNRYARHDSHQPHLGRDR